MRSSFEQMTAAAIVDSHDVAAGVGQNPWAKRPTVRAHVLVDSHMRVISNDLDAESMLSASKVSELAIIQGHLQAACPTWQDHLATLVLDNDLATARIAASTSPRATLRVEVRRLCKNGVHALAPQLRLVVITSNSLSADAGQAAAFYGLTKAEAQILNVLCTGRRLCDYVSCRKVTINTARTQLKSVLAKLGVRSQVEAVRLVFLMHLEARLLA